MMKLSPKQSVEGVINYRPIKDSDKQQMKELHEEFFPVRYSDNFYNDMVRGVGINRGELFTQIATVTINNTSGEASSCNNDYDTNDNIEKIVGFVLAQFLNYPQQCEDHNIFKEDGDTASTPRCVCYILTLGLRPEYRRYGIGSYLIHQCKHYARTRQDCGALYLHVIHYNEAAIEFYRRNEFMKLRLLRDFYCIENKYYDAYLYMFYINGCSPPMADAVSVFTSSFFHMSWNLITSIWSTLSSPLQWLSSSTTLSMNKSSRAIEKSTLQGSISSGRNVRVQPELTSAV